MSESVGSFNYSSNFGYYILILRPVSISIVNKCWTLKQTYKLYSISRTQTIAFNLKLPDSCNGKLISAPEGVPDQSVTASSYYKDILHDDSPYCAKWNQSVCGGWSPVISDKQQWIQVSFPTFPARTLHLLFRNVMSILLWPFTKSNQGNKNLNGNLKHIFNG